MSSGERDRRRLEVEERRAEALELRVAGYSYRAIAERLGCSVSTAHGLVDAALREVPAPGVERLRQVQGEQIDLVIRSLWPHVLKGSARHAEVLIRALERQAKLLGLDAPQERIVEVLTADLLERALKDLEADIARMGELPPWDDAELGTGDEDDGEDEC